MLARKDTSSSISADVNNTGFIVADRTYNIITNINHFCLAFKRLSNLQTNISRGGFPMISLIRFKTFSEGFLGARLSSTYPCVTALSMSLLVYPNLRVKYTGSIPFIVTICSSNWYSLVKLGGMHFGELNHVWTNFKPSIFNTKHRFWRCVSPLRIAIL